MGELEGALESDDNQGIDNGNRGMAQIISMVKHIEFQDIISSAIHSRDFRASRAEYFNIRVRVLAFAYALLAPLWLPLDYWALPTDDFYAIATLRIIFTVSLLAVALICGQRCSLEMTRLRLGLFITVPGLFYVGSRLLLGGEMEGEGIIAGYSFLPYLMVALMAIFPLTLIEGAGFALLSISFYIIAEFLVGDLFSLNALGDLWMLFLLATIAIWVQMTQLHMLMRLYREATRDALTGLVNRRVLFGWMEREIESEEKSNKPFSVLLFDLDLFKRINDTYGHLTGDYVLREFASLLNQTLPKSALVGRYGGEEFLAILPNTPVSEAKHLAEKVRNACHEARVQVADSDESIGFTTSTGVAQYKAGENPNELLGRVDTGLYHAKESGRDLVAVAE